MSGNDRALNLAIRQKILSLLKERLGIDFKIESAIYLSQPDRRNVLMRITLQSESDSAPKSIIFKQSLVIDPDTDKKEDEMGAYARFSRDWAGLEFMSTLSQSAHSVPRFFGGDKEDRFILIEDLGFKHVSLVDSLTFSDRDKAILALERFMKALGAFHAASFGHVEEYEKILKKINENIDSSQKFLDEISTGLLQRLGSSFDKIGLPVTESFISEALQVLKAMIQPDSFTVLVHGDIAPDNVFDHDGDKGLQLIDFEWSFIRNAMLDVTHLRMCMPTGWCAKAIPNEIIKYLEKIYRKELAKNSSIPMDEETYVIAYTQACAYHVLHEMIKLNHILEKDILWGSDSLPKDSLWNSETNLSRPRFLSRLQSFVEVACEYGRLPNLRKMAEEILVKVKARWPDAKPLEYYPAFEHDSFESKITHPLVSEGKSDAASVAVIARKLDIDLSSSPSGEKKAEEIKTYDVSKGKAKTPTDEYNVSEESCREPVAFPKEPKMPGSRG